MGMLSRTLHLVATALLATGLFPATPARAFENINMNVSLSVNQDGNMVVQWEQGGFDEYHVGWRVNGGPRDSRSRPGDKRFTVLMHYTPGAVYYVEVQGCTKHAIGHDQCTSWDDVSCGGSNAPCTGSPEALRRRRPGYTF